MDPFIRLHPEHGINPTIGVCFWCGKDDGTIALLGASCEGEAPMRSILSYEPCAACKKQMRRGILCIEIDRARFPDRAPLNKADRDSVPTGRWCVVKREAAERMFSDYEGWDAIRQAGGVQIASRDWTAIGLPSDEKTA